MTNYKLHENVWETPCLVCGERAIFLGWFNMSYILEPSMLVGGHNGGPVSMVKGLVRLSNGQVGLVSLDDLIFPPSTFEEYDWSWCEKALEKQNLNRQNGRKKND